MKKIVVLTDFSKAAKNAADTAIELAIPLHADILLVNSYLFSMAIFAIEGEGRTMMDSELLATASKKALEKEAKRLKRLIDQKTATTFKPSVDSYCAIESVNQMIHTLNHTIPISMLLMGVHQTSLPVIFSAIDMERLLNEASYPVLVVPKNQTRFQLKNFVFAADLNNDSFAALRKIMDYAKIFKFHIDVCHVSAPVFIPDFIEEDNVRKFGHHVAMLGTNVTFTNLKGKNIAKTLNQFNGAIGADMMGIVYHQHSLGWKFIHGSHTLKLARKQQLPLLIFSANFLKIDNGKP